MQLLIMSDDLPDGDGMGQWNIMAFNLRGCLHASSGIFSTRSRDTIHMAFRQTYLRCSQRSIAIHRQDVLLQPKK
jgi:hypothetical protein